MTQSTHSTYCTISLNLCRLFIIFAFLYRFSVLFSVSLISTSQLSIHIPCYLTIYLSICLLSISWTVYMLPLTQQNVSLVVELPSTVINLVQLSVILRSWLRINRHKRKMCKPAWCYVMTKSWCVTTSVTLYSAICSKNIVFTYSSTWGGFLLFWWIAESNQHTCIVVRFSQISAPCISTPWNFPHQTFPQWVFLHHSVVCQQQSTKSLYKNGRMVGWEWRGELSSWCISEYVFEHELLRYYCFCTPMTSQLFTRKL